MAAFVFKVDMIELLSPAGDMDCLTAAIESGADAVYCGGKSFSARSYAGNFDHDGMKKAAAYCHVRGKKIYAALNTMILEREMESALSEAAYLSSIGIDALIVSDIGLAEQIIKNLGVPVHASTQMCIHDAAGAMMLKERGVKRVIPARELSLGEIRAIADTGIETEVFIHGALCSSVSGLCLMSSFIGQRSGNRGCCAQPCRLKYRSADTEGYLLSTADLCLAEHIEELKSAGVCSLKIEGRMKSPDYVAGVTDVYSRLLKGDLSGSRAKEELSRFYNRTFTDAYLTGRTDVCAPDRPDTRAEGEPRAQVNPKSFVFPEAEIILKEGVRPVINVKAGDVCVQTEGENALEKARTAVPDESIKASLSKTGGTPFEFSRIDIVREGEPYISRADLNALRRNALSGLEESMVSVFERPSDADKEISCCLSKIPHEMREICVETGDKDIAAAAALKGAHRIYYAPEVYSRDILKATEEIYEKSGKKPYIRLLPYMNAEGYENLKKVLKGNEGRFSGMLAGHFSQVSVFGGFDDVVMDHTCNTANGASVKELKKMGASTVTLSSELAKRDILHLSSCLKTEIIVYGILPVMWIAHEVFGSSMTDRRGYGYDLRRYESGSFSICSIGNPDRLCLKEIGRLKNAVDSLRIIADSVSDLDMMDIYARASEEGRDLSIETQGTTQGHLLRGV